MHGEKGGKKSTTVAVLNGMMKYNLHTHPNFVHNNKLQYVCMHCECMQIPADLLK
jgi:hypothetical protein